MAVENPPGWLENDATHHAVLYRRMLAKLIGFPGVDSSTSLAVSEKSGTPDGTVDVAAGGAFILGDDAADQGMYHGQSLSVENRAIDPTAGLPRNDLIVARVDDTEYNVGGDDDWDIVVLKGTPDAVPADPDPDADYDIQTYELLARVEMPASTSTVIDSYITDLRRFAHRRMWQEITTGGPTSGLTALTLATVTIPAQAVSYQLEATAHWTGINTTAADQFIFLVRVDGVEKARVTERPQGGNERRAFQIPSITLTQIAANTAAVVTVAISREAGTGTITTEDNGLLTVMIRPFV